MITIKNLSKSFGDLNVLKNIDLEIAKGEIMVIVGPSGSGKSTLLRCMNLLEIPTGGEIIFEGKNLVDKKTNIDEVRQNIGMVFQNFNLFPHKTILDNITLAPIKLKKMTKEEAEKKAEILLSRVGLLDKKDSYPSQLSGGQKQRIAIARALAMEPDMMLFDEPTSALDPEGEGKGEGRKAAAAGGHRLRGRLRPRRQESGGEGRGDPRRLAGPGYRSGDDEAVLRRRGGRGHRHLERPHGRL